MTQPAPASLSIERSLNRQVGAVVSAVMIMAAIASLIVTLIVFGDGIHAQLTAKADAAGDLIRRDIATALDLGIPFKELRGLDILAQQIASEMPEIAVIEVVQPTAVDSPLEASREFGSVWAGLIPGANDDALNMVLQQSILSNGAPVAALRITLDRDFMAEQMREVFFDTLIILIVTILVAIELMAYLTGRMLLGPLRVVQTALAARAAGRFPQYGQAKVSTAFSSVIAACNTANARISQRASVYLARPGITDFVLARDLQKTTSDSGASIIDARIPLFVFCFAEELQKSFLPLFVAELHQPTDLFAEDIMMGLPISMFMLVIAVLTPFAGKLVDRYGNRRLFLVGLLPAIAGYVMCAFAASGNDIVLGRSITAVGYAVITISCQSYIAKVVSARNRARGMAVFVGVLMAATLCGTAIGAILADWLDYKPVFVIAACLAGLAGVLGFLMLDPLETEKTPAAKGGAGSVLTLLRNHRFLSLLVFCAIPAKVVLTGVLYLFVPVYLVNLDVSQSEIGRIMMVYALVIIPISPLAAGFADRVGQNLKVAAMASFASGVVLFGLFLDPSAIMVLAIVAGLGIAHAFLKAPLIVSVMDVAESIPDVPMTAALGLLRTCERIGSFVGPILVAVLMTHFSDAGVAALVGAAVSVFAALLLILLRPAGPTQQSAA
ncbi:MAG: MFS transporter [Pseudomonadota bacterium]